MWTWAHPGPDMAAPKLSLPRGHPGSECGSLGALLSPPPLLLPPLKCTGYGVGSPQWRPLLVWIHPVLCPAKFSSGGTLSGQMIARHPFSSSFAGPLWSRLSLTDPFPRHFRQPPFPSPPIVTRGALPDLSSILLLTLNAARPVGNLILDY